MIDIQIDDMVFVSQGEGEEVFGRVLSVGRDEMVVRPMKARHQDYTWRIDLLDPVVVTRLTPEGSPIWLGPMADVSPAESE